MLWACVRGWEIDVLVSLMLLDKKEETLYDAFIEPRVLPISVGAVDKRKLVLSPSHGADSVKELGEKLPSVIGEHVSRRAVCVHPVVQGHVDSNIGRDSPRRYKVNHF